MWNWLVSALASKASIILYDGSPFIPDNKHLFEIAEEEGINFFGTGAKFLDTLKNNKIKIKESFKLNSLNTLASTGSPLVNESFEYVYKNIKSKKIWELNDFQGNWLVMYFYPKDFTAGCTLEAKGFSELKKDFSKYNAEIVGISADNQDSHESFCSEKSINYTLLSDPDGIISNKYGSWIPPFSDRNTFLISPDGKISYRWISVLPINHAKEVLNVLKKKI